MSTSPPTTSPPTPSALPPSALPPSPGGPSAPSPARLLLLLTCWALSALAWAPAFADGSGEVAAAGEPVCHGEASAQEPTTLAAQRIVVDPETGEIVGEPPAVEQRQPVVGRSLSQRVSTSHAGLVEEVAPGGSVKVNLQGRFTTMLVGRVGPDGEVTVGHGAPEESGQ